MVFVISQFQGGLGTSLIRFHLPSQAAGVVAPKKTLPSAANGRGPPQKAARNLGQRVKGIEPSSVAWKATALPLSYTRVRAAQVGAPASSCQVLFPGRRDLPTAVVATSTLL